LAGMGTREVRPEPTRRLRASLLGKDLAHAEKRILAPMTAE
jgi:hypothetical protein